MPLITIIKQSGTLVKAIQLVIKINPFTNNLVSNKLEKQYPNSN